MIIFERNGWKVRVDTIEELGKAANVLRWLEENFREPSDISSSKTAKTACPVLASFERSNVKRLLQGLEEAGTDGKTIKEIYSLLGIKSNRTLGARFKSLRQVLQVLGFYEGDAIIRSREINGNRLYLPGSKLHEILEKLVD